MKRASNTSSTMLRIISIVIGIELASLAGGIAGGIVGFTVGGFVEVVFEIELASINGGLFGFVAGGSVGYILGGFFELRGARAHSATVTPVPTPTLVPPETVITFPDKNLELSIRSALGRGAGGVITAGELAELTILLNLYTPDIADLTGIEHLVHLTQLNSGSNQISDLSPLTNLTNLTELHLGGNQISDLSPLVENSELGEGDMVWLWSNRLDLLEGSEDLENIRRLRTRGVTVRAEDEDFGVGG